MNASLARDLLLYTLWADRAVTAVLREVSPEHLTREAGVSFGSLLGTLAHTLGAQRVWLSRFTGAPLDRLPSAQDYPDLPSWLAGWEENASQLEAFLAALTDEQLAASISWINFRGDAFTRPLWQPVIHLVNHTTYHRGQIVSLLRQMGYTPPSTDLIYWYNERG